MGQACLKERLPISSSRFTEWIRPGSLRQVTGLGLAITERAVLLHGGQVKAVNFPVGGLLVEISLSLV